jgi:hypothetical protein
VVYDRVVNPTQGSADWRSAFVATSVLIGTTVDEALALLETGGVREELLGSLRATSKATRVKALAAELAAVAADVEALAWRW